METGLKDEDDNTAFERWFGLRSTLVALGVLLLSFAIPPQGLGITVCWFNSLTGIPCPGCGLTRSLSCAAHGLFEESWSHHPFGIPLIFVFGVTAILGALPRTRRRTLRDWIRCHPGSAQAAYWLVLGSFVVFGFTRAVVAIHVRLFG